MSQVITTILLDDNPNGLRIVDVANWSGKAFVIPRSKLKELKSRSDASQPGLYILFGEGNNNPAAYVGQSESIIDRLMSHDVTREEDEWNIAVAFVGSLDSTSIKYLECIALSLAKKAKRFEIINRGGVNENTVSEAQKIATETYFEKIRLIIGLLGYPIFEAVSESIADKKVYNLKAEGANANAQLLDDGSLNVLKGSYARIKETVAFTGWSKVARIKFLAEGILIEAGDDVSYKFTQDVVFKSPSAAAATVTGRPINGWTAWKDNIGKTLDENIRK